MAGEAHTCNIKVFFFLVLLVGQTTQRTSHATTIIKFHFLYPQSNQTNWNWPLGVHVMAVKKKKRRKKRKEHNWWWWVDDVLYGDRLWHGGDLCFLSEELFTSRAGRPSPYLKQTGNAEYNVHTQRPGRKCGKHFHNKEVEPHKFQSYTDIST